MARNKTKICFGCQCLFEARRDAKTCSTKCRKRFQRAKNLYYVAKSEVPRVAAKEYAYNDTGQQGGISYAT